MYTSSSLSFRAVDGACALARLQPAPRAPVCPPGPHGASQDWKDDTVFRHQMRKSRPFPADPALRRHPEHRRTNAWSSSTLTGFGSTQAPAATRRESFEGLFGKRPRARILVEASTESEWVARCLERLGHEVVAAGLSETMRPSATREQPIDRRPPAARGPPDAPRCRSSGERWRRGAASPSPPKQWRYPGAVRPDAPPHARGDRHRPGHARGPIRPTWRCGWEASGPCSSPPGSRSR
jgi:hypothetical protein